MMARTQVARAARVAARRRLRAVADRQLEAVDRRRAAATYPRAARARRLEERVLPAQVRPARVSERAKAVVPSAAVAAARWAEVLRGVQLPAPVVRTKAARPVRRAREHRLLAARDRWLARAVQPVRRATVRSGAA